jgi:K+-transporting ATPase KdpF subunit
MSAAPSVGPSEGAILRPENQCEDIMLFDYAASSVVTFGVLVYLLYVLIRPERF